MSKKYEFEKMICPVDRKACLQTECRYDGTCYSVKVAKINSEKNIVNQNFSQEETITPEEMFEFIRWKDKKRFVFEEDKWIYKGYGKSTADIFIVEVAKNDVGLWNKYKEEKNRKK